jgi:hypothetical protein
MVDRLFDSADPVIDSKPKPLLDPVRDADLSQQTGILAAKFNDDYLLEEADVIFTGLSNFIDAISWHPQSRSWLGFGMSADKQFGITVKLH